MLAIARDLISYSHPAAANQIVIVRHVGSVHGLSDAVEMSWKIVLNEDRKRYLALVDS